MVLYLNVCSKANATQALRVPGLHGWRKPAKLLAFGISARRSPSKHTFDASAACCMMRIREAPVGSEEKPSANHQGLQGVASKT